jgi:flagellar hook-associated protein 3 FlgL
MRISTANSYQSSLDALVDRKVSLDHAEQQMTTGKRVNRASDDPAAAARAERALASERRSIASQRSVDASSNAMALTESALGDVTELLQSAREALLAAGNASYSDAERSVKANELAGLRQQLFTVANRSDGAGNYLFGGQGANQQPFVDAAGGVQFHGTSGTTQAASGEALPLTMDGQPTWMQARTGNGVFETRAVTSTGSAWIDPGSVTNPSQITGSSYRIQFAVVSGATTYSVLKDGLSTTQTNLAFTPGQAVQIDGMAVKISGAPANGDRFDIVPSTASLTVFDALDKAVADLKNPGRTGTQIQQTNSSSLSQFDSVLGQTISARSQVGATMARIDNVTGRLSALQLSSKTERSNAEDLDMTQAISDVGNQQSGYDAALKAYSMVQRLSLFNYLSS